MPGGLLSILSYGSTDLFLTGSPQITFFKTVYRRHTNFSIESIEIGYNTDINFGDEYEIIYDRIGDLVGKSYLKIKIPEVYFSRNELSLPTVPISEPNNNNYIIVETFMKYNINAYRKSVDNNKLENLSIDKFLIDISNNFAGDGQIALNNFIDLQNQYFDPLIKSLFFNSNIYNIYLKYIDNQDITKNELFKQVETCIIFSKECQKIFWELYEEELRNYNTVAQNNLKFAWNNNIGFNIIDYIDVRLGGEQIDRHYGNFFEVSYQMRKKNKLDKIYNQMIGNLSDLTTYNENVKPEYFITIPLNFWFNKNMGSAFPLVASQYSDLSLRIKFRNINQCGIIELLEGETYSLEDFWNDKQYKLEVSLLADYIFLDGTERRKFAQSSHEYLIENVQTITEVLSNYESQINESKINDIIQLRFIRDGFIFITPTIIFDAVKGKIKYDIKLDLKHPCKQLIWTFQRQKYLEDKNGTQKSIYNNYTIFPFFNSIKPKDPLINGNILLNGYDRINKKVGTNKYYNLIQAFQHNTNITDEGIYSYSFSIFPEELQPSSSCNFSRFLNQVLHIELDENMFFYSNQDIEPKTLDNANIKYFNYTDVVFNLYAIGYNVIRISGGFSALAFSYT